MPAKGSTSRWVQYSPLSGSHRQRHDLNFITASGALLGVSCAAGASCGPGVSCSGAALSAVLVKGDGSSGFVVPPGRPDRLAERIAKVLCDNALHRRFSEAAIDHSRRFTIAACADAHIELYETVLASRRR